jgi:cytidylate kinase
MLDRGLDPGDAAAAVAAARALAPDDVEPSRLRGEGVGQNASRVAAVPDVRAALLPFQRRFAASPPGAVLAGRDVGTVVCPDATFKLFVTASDTERARRRFEELRARGDGPIYAAVLEELQERDHRDADRVVAPMRIAPDAWVLDTTSLDAQTAFQAARDHIEAGLADAGRPAVL